MGNELCFPKSFNIFYIFYSNIEIIRNKWSVPTLHDMLGVWILKPQDYLKFIGNCYNLTKKKILLSFDKWANRVHFMFSVYFEKLKASSGHLILTPPIHFPNHKTDNFKDSMVKKMVNWFFIEIGCTSHNMIISSIKKCKIWPPS